MRKFIFFSLVVICFIIAQDTKPANKKKIRVYVSMVADLFHYGHVTFLKQAKEFGDHLIVGLISDEDATPYKRQPIFTLEERARTIIGCRYVDEIIPKAPLCITKEWIEKHHIDIVVHGDDFDKEKMTSFFKDPVKMGIMRIVPYTPGISTTMIVARIKQRFLQNRMPIYNLNH